MNHHRATGSPTSPSGSGVPYHDAEDARTFDEHLDDITFEQVLAMWRADCDAHGVTLPAAVDPLADPAFAAAVAAAYAGPFTTA